MDEEPKTDSEPKLTVSSSPHIYTTESIPKIMYSVVAALMPAFIGALYFFGWRALWLTAIAVLVSIVTEAIIQKFRKVDITVTDGSVIVTGILLAFNLPAGVPWWIPAVGAFFAVAIGKHAFGGLGFNPMNPALLGRAFLMASWPVHMTTDWTNEFPFHHVFGPKNLFAFFPPLCLCNFSCLHFSFPSQFFKQRKYQKHRNCKNRQCDQKTA